MSYHPVRVFNCLYCKKNVLLKKKTTSSSVYFLAEALEMACCWCCGFTVISQATQTCWCGNSRVPPPPPTLYSIPVQHQCNLALSQCVSVLIVSYPNPSAPLLQQTSPVIQLALQQDLSFCPTAGPVPTATTACRQAPRWHRRHNKTPTCISDSPLCTHSHRQTRTHSLSLFVSLAVITTPAPRLGRDERW